MSGKQVVEVTDDGLTCSVCHRQLEQAGTHFARIHGYEFGKRDRAARLAALGLPAGTRLASQRLLGLGRARANIETMGLARLRHGESLRSARAGAALLRRSDLQLLALASLNGTARHGGAVRKAQARCERRCLQCQKVFVTFHSTTVRFCSRSCASIFNNAKRFREREPR